MGQDRGQFNTQIAEEAAEWFVELQEGESPSHTLANFSRWLRTSPQHVHAYLRLAAFWEEADLLRRPVQDLESIALRIANGSEVVALRAGSAPAVKLAARPRRRAGWAVAATVGIASLVVATLAWMRADMGAIHATEVGEQRSLTLEDGSVLQLNARTRVRIRFSEAQRRVELLEGQALFEVAKQAARPFVVIAGDASVRAVGTQFDVYRKSSGTVVTVLEGQVAVTSGAHAPSPARPGSRIEPERPGRHDAVLLEAGQQVIVTPAAILEPRSTDLEVAMAWTRKKLVFESAPLSEVVAEFNRYNSRVLLIDDPLLGEVRITGEFNPADVDHLVEFLRERFAVDVHARPGETRISMERSRP